MFGGEALVVLAVFVRLLFSRVAHVVTLSYSYVVPLFARGSLGTGLIKLFLLGLTEVLIIQGPGDYPLAGFGAEP